MVEKKKRGLRSCVRWRAYFHNLHSDGGDSIIDEFTHSWMPVLSDGVVIFPGFEEGLLGVDGACVED